MTREDMHAVLDAAIKANDGNEVFEIDVEFTRSVDCSEGMVVYMTAWDNEKLRRNEEGKLVASAFYYDAESAIKAIMAYKEAQHDTV